jgi:hypothetical protein
MNVMKASIIVTDDAGNSWKCELPLTTATPLSTGFGVAPKKRSRASTPTRDEEGPGTEPRPDLSLPLRPFMKRNAQGVSGAKKFTLLVAHLAKGDLDVEVPRADVEKQWNKMKGLLGGPFNAAHSSRAKDNGWVDSPKFGAYKLLAGWEGALMHG